MEITTSPLRFHCYRVGGKETGPGINLGPITCGTGEFTDGRRS